RARAVREASGCRYNRPPRRRKREDRGRRTPRQTARPKQGSFFAWHEFNNSGRQKATGKMSEKCLSPGPAQKNSCAGPASDYDAAMPTAYDELLDAAIRHLQDLQEHGVRHVPVSPEM